MQYECLIQHRIYASEKNPVFNKPFDRLVCQLLFLQKDCNRPLGQFCLPQCSQRSQRTPNRKNGNTLVLRNKTAMQLGDGPFKVQNCYKKCIRSSWIREQPHLSALMILTFILNIANIKQRRRSLPQTMR
jgi:hypothetical protein